MCFGDLCSEVSQDTATSVTSTSAFCSAFIPGCILNCSRVLRGSVCCAVTTPHVGFWALIWSCRFPWLLFHLLSHLLWCIKPSLVVCVLLILLIPLIAGCWKTKGINNWNKDWNVCSERVFLLLKLRLFCSYSQNYSSSLNHLFQMGDAQRWDCLKWGSAVKVFREPARLLPAFKLLNLLCN